MSYVFRDNTEQVLKELSDAKERALLRIGMAAEGYAKKECPVDTGNLRDNITHDEVPSEDATYVGTNVEYGAYVELGTINTAAQPYLRPAATEHSSTYQRIVREEMGG